jgi:hypothetical protein
MAQKCHARLLLLRQARATNSRYHQCQAGKFDISIQTNEMYVAKEFPFTI